MTISIEFLQRGAWSLPAGLAHGLARLRHAIEREVRIRHAISKLHRLDARDLADIGIERSEIARVVRRARRDAELRRRLGIRRPAAA